MEGKGENGTPFTRAGFCIGKTSSSASLNLFTRCRHQIANRLLNGRRVGNRACWQTLAFALPLLPLLTGCGSVNTVRADGTVVRHYFGYTRVIVPVHASSNGQFSVMEISSSGARLWPSVGLGHFHERNEYIPLDSRIVVRVQNQQQLDEVVRVLAPIAKDGLCVTTE